MAFRSATGAFMAGVRALLPLTPGVVPFGLVTGVMAIDMGMSPTTAMSMTLLFYSGSAQMVALQLLNQGVVPVAIVVTALIINLRFIMYSVSMAPHLQGMPRRKTWPLAYLLSDQSFALCTFKLDSGELGRFALPFYVGTALTMWLVWNLSVLTGILVGAKVPQAWSLSFTVPLSFLALLVPAIRNIPSLAAAVVGGLLAVLAIRLPYNLGLVTAAIGGVAAGLFTENLRNRTLQVEGQTP